MSTDNRVTQLIVQLNRETAAGKIKWKATAPPGSLTQGTEDIVHHFFETIYKGKIIGVFERRYRHFTDEDMFFWSNQIVLSILDNPNQRKILWEYSDYSPALLDLFSIVREQCSGIDEWLDKLLE
jgi:hypothetical protein